MKMEGECDGKERGGLGWCSRMKKKKNII